MSAIEQRARELLAAIPASPTPEDESERVMVWEKDALAAIIDALTIAEKFKSQAGCAITLAESAQRRADRAALTPPDGFVLVPVQPTETMKVAGSMWNTEMDTPPDFDALMCIWRDMLAARPEVKL